MDMPIPARNRTIFTRITQIAAIFACVFGALALVGWQFDIAVLKTVGTNASATLKPIAALLFILSGLSLWLTQKSTPQGVSRAYRIGQALAFLIMLIGLLVLAEYAFHWNPGFDQWLFHDAVLKEAQPFPGRLALIGAVYFAFMGLAMLLASTPPSLRVNHLLAQIFIGIICSISLMNIFGFIYGLEELSIRSLLIITFYTVPMYFVVLSIGIFAAHSEWGPAALLSGENVGSQMARRLLLTVILIPLIIGWVILKFEQAGLFQHTYAASLNGLITSAVLGYLIWLTAQSLNRADQRRSLVEESLREREQKLSTLLNLLPVGISILDQERKVTFQNAALSQILELTPEGLLAGAYKNRTYLTADGTPMSADSFASVQAEKSGAAVYNVETGVVKEDGATVWTSVSAVPVDFPDWKTVIVTADITPRKQAEKILEDERRNIEALIENTDGSIWSVDAQYRLIVGNTRYHQDTSAALGRKLVEGESVLVESFPPAALAEWRGYYDRTLQGENFSVEVQTRFADPVHHVEYRFNPIRTGTGAIVGVTIFGRDITERKRAEEAIRESQELFLKAFRSNPGAMVISRLADGLLMDFNASYEQMFEYTREELVGKTSTSVNIIAPEARHVIIEKLQADGYVHSYETTFRTKSGKLIHALFSIEKIELAGEQCMLTVIYDITERKLAEERLRNSEEFVRLAYEAANLGIWKNDLQTGSVEFDERARIHYGFDTLHTTLGEVTSRVHPDDLANLGAEIAAATAPTGTGKFATDYRVIHPDGSIHWLAIGVRVTFTGEGEGRQALMGYGTSLDITERKRIEAALQESEQKYAMLFEKSTVPTVLLKLPEVTIMDANEACEQLTGFARSEMFGKTAAELGVGKKEEREELISEFEHKGALEHNEVRISTKSGEKRTVVVNTMPVKISEEMCAITTMQDVTERKRMEIELRRSNAELEQFAYIASHDLQEPLRTIAGMVQLLQKRYQGQLDERADEYIGHAVESAARMQALIKDLLAYSRVDRKNQPITEVSAQDCLQAALKNLRVAIEESHAAITADDLPTVHADPTQLMQLFQNLIGNSLKFRAAEPPQVQITATQLHDAWQFAVRDNGIGIEPQYFERIFLVFQRLHTRRQYQGTGIGLALSKKIIERHGGSIWLESKPGQGSTFYFTLPLRSNP